MFTCVETLFAKTYPVKTFFETDLLSPESRGRTAEQLETEGSQLLMVGNVPVEYLVGKTHWEPHGVFLLHK